MGTFIAVVLVLLVGVLTGCGSSSEAKTSTDSHPPTPGVPVASGGGEVVRPLSSGQERQDCLTVLKQTPIAADNLVVVVDPTASVGVMTIPDALDAEIARVSKLGVSISLFMTDGKGAAPVVVLKRPG